MAIGVVVAACSATELVSKQQHRHILTQDECCEKTSTAVSRADCGSTPPSVSPSAPSFEDSLSLAGPGCSPRSPSYACRRRRPGQQSETIAGGYEIDAGARSTAVCRCSSLLPLNVSAKPVSCRSSPSRTSEPCHSSSSFHSLQLRGNFRIAGERDGEIEAVRVDASCSDRSLFRSVEARMQQLATHGLPGNGRISASGGTSNW